MAKKLVSYAQNREDLILHVLLHGVKQGFYVDVGANNPDIDSVTRLFYENGWHGINIEPISSLHQELERRRPKDINLNLGVSTKNDSLKLREFTNGLHGWSTFDSELQSERADQPHIDYEVPTKPLSAIFKDQSVKQIDFLKVDVEGLEFEVLSSNDWRRFRPKVVMIENSEKRCIDLLIEQGYLQVFFDGLNTYFVRQDLSDIHTIDNYIPALLSGQSVMTASEDQTVKQLALTEKVLRQTREKLDEIDQLYKDQLKQADSLRNQQASILDHPEDHISAKQLGSSLLRAVTRKLGL